MDKQTTPTDPTYTPPMMDELSPSSEQHLNEAVGMFEVFSNFNPMYVSRIKEQIKLVRTQARREVFALMRDVLTDRYVDDRFEMLQDVLTGWVGCGHTGFEVVEYDVGVDRFSIFHSRHQDDGPTERRAASAKVIEGADDDLTPAQIVKILSEPSTAADTTNPHPEYPWFMVDHSTIELGLRRIRDAENVPDKPNAHSNERGLTTIRGLGQGLRNAIIKADMSNDTGDLDIWGFTAIVEIALLNEVRYA